MRRHVLRMRVRGLLGIGRSQRLCIAQRGFCVGWLFYRNGVGMGADRIGKLRRDNSRDQRVVARCMRGFGRRIDVFVRGKVTEIVDCVRCRRVHGKRRIVLGFCIGQRVHGNRRVVRLRLCVFGVLRRCGRVEGQRASIEVLRQILRTGQFDRGIVVVYRVAGCIDIVQLVQEHLRRPLRFRQGVHQRTQALGQRCKRGNQRRIGA